MRLNLTILFILMCLLTLNLADEDITEQIIIQQTQQTTTEQQTINQEQNEPSIPSQQDQHIQLKLDESYQTRIQGEWQSQRYSIVIDQDKVSNLNNDKWYLFIDLQPSQQYQWEKTKIQLFMVNEMDNQMPIKECDSVNGIDSCFITNSNFDYKSSKIHVKVTCQEVCEFKISAEISTKYVLQGSQKLQLDFQNTAYSKLFSLDTQNYPQFLKLQIILIPSGFLSFSAPINIYMNRGKQVPTRQNNDYSCIHLWDDGCGIFINYPQANDQFTILIEGPQSNILTLETKLVYENQPKQTLSVIPYFSYIASRQKQLFKIKINKNQKTHIKLTTLSGSVFMSDMLDESSEKLKEQFTVLQRSYGELQYEFSTDFFDKNRDANINEFIFVEITAKKDSTFIFQSYTDNNEIDCLMPEVDRYSDLKTNLTDQYYIELMQLSDSLILNEGQARLSVVTTTYSEVELNTHIFICQQEIPQKCQISKENINRVNRGQNIDNELLSQMELVIDNSIQGVRYYDVRIPEKQFFQRGGIRYAYIIIVITNEDQDENQIMYTLQYINVGKSYFLKEKQLKKDRISIDEIKYYTFINNDPDVKSIKIHSTEISGSIIMQGYLSDPRKADMEGQQIYEYHNAIAFENIKQGDQIYVIVQGIESAYFSLYMQIIRKSEQNNTATNSTGYNQLVIYNGHPYQFILKPKQKMIFQIHAETEQFQLIMSSHLPLKVCMTENILQPPFNPNCEISETLSKVEIVNVQMDKGLIANIGIENHNDKSVEFNIQIKEKNIDCQNAVIGRMTSLNASDPQQSSKKYEGRCLRYVINQREQLQIIVELGNKNYIGSNITIDLNGQEREIMLNSKHIMKKNEIERICGDQSKLCYLKIQVITQQLTNIDVIVQFLNGEIILADGISHPIYYDFESSIPKHFIYNLINKINTTIVMESQSGSFNFYGKIVSRRQLNVAKLENKTIYPSADDYVIKSENLFFYLHQIYKLTSQQIEKSDCVEQCLLLLSVVPQNSYITPIKMRKFRIQCTQQDHYLKENEPVTGFLQKNSYAFYEYYHECNNTMYVQLHNQNTQCAIIYVKRGSGQRALQDDYQKMIQSGNTLIYEDAQQGSYSITVQSKTQACSYTIQIISSDNTIKAMKRGVFSDVVLQSEESVFYTYFHHNNSPFKIMSLNRFGQVLIKIRQLTQKQLSTFIGLSPQDWLKQSTSLSYSQSNVDSLSLKGDSLQLCNCHYLINIVASKYTITSIVIPSPEVELSLVAETTVKDILQKEQKSVYRVYTANLAQFRVFVQYGKIQLLIRSSIDNDILLNKTYQQTKEPIYEQFETHNMPIDFEDDMINDDSSDFYNPFSGTSFYSKVTVTGIDTSSFYSFELLATEQTVKNGDNVKFGIPQYIFLDGKQIQCMKGLLQDSSQEFILSFDYNRDQIVQEIDIKCKVDGKNISYETEIGVNEMVIKFSNLNIEGPTPYSVCLKSKDFLSITFIQSAQIMLLPSNTYVFLSHPTNMTIGAQGEIVLQVDQCNGKAVTSVSSQFNNLHNFDSQIQIVRKSNNLIEFNHWGPIYIHVETKSSRVKWRSKNKQRSSGIGYDKMRASTAIAYKNGDSIRVDITPVDYFEKYSSKTDFKVTYINYKVILAKDQAELYSAINCANGDVIVSQGVVTTFNESFNASFTIVLITIIQTDDLRTRFKGKKYFFAGVIANVNIDINSIIESYRFIYPAIDIQKEVLAVGSMFNDEDNQMGGFRQLMPNLLFIVLILIFGVLCSMLYKKYIKKCLERRSRLREQGLSDQGSGNFKYTEFASMTNH